MSTSRRVALIVAAAFSTVVAAQPPDSPATTFEAASVKPHATRGINERSGVEENPSAIRVENLPLKALIETAYGVRDYQFSGPGWLGTERYDVIAKPPSGFTDAQLQPLLQALLFDRFKLRAHHESREMGIFEVRVAQSGLRLKESTGPRTFFTARPALISGTRVSMRELAGAFSRLLDREVIDQTGLSGVYDVNVQWTPESATGDLGVSLFTAVQEQLGLKLESTKGRVDVIVVDHVERPAPD